MSNSFEEYLERRHGGSSGASTTSSTPKDDFNDYLERRHGDSGGTSRTPSPTDTNVGGRKKTAPAGAQGRLGPTLGQLTQERQNELFPWLPKQQQKQTLPLVQQAREQRRAESPSLGQITQLQQEAAAPLSVDREQRKIRDQVNNAINEQKEQARERYGYDESQSRRSDAGYYTDHVQQAVAARDYDAAAFWMDKLVQAPLTQAERQKAADYINSLYGGDSIQAPFGTAPDAASKLVSAYDKDMRSYADLLDSEDGADILRDVTERYGISAALAYSDPDAYIEAVRSARGSDKDAELSDQARLAYYDFSNGQQTYLTQNAKTAFLQRGQNEIAKAAASGQTGSAQIDSYTRAQMATEALDNLYNRLDVGGNGATYMFDSNGNLTDTTAQWLVDELKDYGVDLSGMTEADYRSVIETALAEQKKKQGIMGRQLTASGFDVNAIASYLTYNRERNYETLRRQSVNDWSASANLGDKIIASAFTVAENSALSMYANIPTLAKLGANIAGGHGNTSRSNEYVPIAAQSKDADLVRGAISERMDGIGGFLYNALMSWADSTANAVMYGAVGGVAANAMGAGAAKIMSQIGTLTTMGTNAAVSAANEILDRGGSNTQAMIGGLASGAVEAITEIMSVENLIRLSKGVGYKQFLKEFAKSFFSEGSEEITGEILDNAIDNINMGNLSKDSEAVRHYVAQDMTLEQAQKQVLIDNTISALEAGLSGALSGGFSTVLVGGPSALRDAVQEVRDVFDEVTLSDDSDLLVPTPQQELEYSQVGDMLDKAYAPENQVDMMGVPIVSEQVEGQYQALAERAEAAETDSSTAPAPQNDRVDAAAEKHTPEQEQVIREYQAAVDPQMVQFIQRAQDVQSPQYKALMTYRVSDVSERQAAAVEAAAGVNVSGYTNAINGTTVAHIDKRHGENGKADSSMADPQDLARIGYVLDQFDNVKLLTNESGAPILSSEWVNSDGTHAQQVLFEKKIDGTYYVAEAVILSKRNTLMVTSAYMNKNGSAAQSLNMEQSSPQLTPETPNGTNASIGNIPQDAAEVNPDSGTVYDLRQSSTDTSLREGGISPASEGQPLLTNEDFDGRQNARATGEEVGGRAGLVPTNQNGGLNNGSTEGAYDGGQRDAGLGAGGQAGAVEGSAGGSVAGGQTKTSDARRKNAILTLNNERVSPEQIGVLGGGSSRNIQVVSDARMFTSDMLDAAMDADAKGQSITWVKGAMEVKNPQTGGMTKVDGIRQVNADGSVQYFIRADMMQRSAGQLYRHEAFHDLAASNTRLWDQMASYIEENFTPQQIARLVNAYAEAYDGIYGDDEASAREYLEEAFADVYAGIQRGRANTEIVKQTMGVFGDQIDQARAGSQNAEAVRDTRGSPEQRYSMEMFNDESDSDKAKRLRNASVEIVQASPESLRAAANIDVSNSKAQDTASILFPILEEFGIFGNQYNQALEIEFDYSKTAGARSLSHQIEITGKNYTAQALVQTNLRELCEKAYPVEAHADEKASDPEAALKQIITLYSALQAGDDAVFAKMTIKIPQKESNRLHMVVTSEVKKGFDLALIAEATKPLSADKSNPRISIPAFLENVKNIGEFTKRIPVDLVLGESTSYKDGLGVSGPGLGRQGESKDTTYLAAVEHGDMETAQRMVDEAAKAAGYTIKAYHGTNSDFTVFDPDRIGSNYHSSFGGFYFRSTNNVGYYGSNTVAVYLKMENPMVLHAADSFYDAEDFYDISPMDRYYSAKSNGNDGIVVQHKKGDMYVVFDSEQIKSAEPVTYDDEGNVIPLSERFDESKPDIRYSMSEEDDGGEVYNGLGVSNPGLGRAGDSSPSQPAADSPLREGAKRGVEDAAPYAGDSSTSQPAADSPLRDGAGTTDTTEGADSSTSLRSAQNDNLDSGELEEAAREKKEALAEKAGKESLKRRIARSEETLRSLAETERVLKQSGLWNETTQKQLQRRRADVQQTLDIDRAQLAEKNKAAKKAKEQQKAAEKKAASPKIAKQEFKTDTLNLFSIQAGSRSELGKVIDRFADKAIAEGSVSFEDRRALLQSLYERGIETIQPDVHYRDIRNAVHGGRVYVNEHTRADFGDDWESFRRRAWGSGVYLTNNRNDMGVDVWNQELAELFPGSFDEQSTDLQMMLESIVSLAEEGKAEHVTLEEMMRRNEQEYGVSVDEQMDELEKKLDQLIDKFAEKAELEAKLRNRGLMEVARERQHFRDMIAREAANRRESQVRNEVMGQIKQLNKMRKRSAPEIQAQIDSILGNLDTVARSISPQGIEDLQALARVYNEAKADENFLPNPYVEARLSRLQDVQLDDLKIEDVVELGRTISALVKSVQDQNRMLADERHREISAAAAQARQEIEASKGSADGKLANWLRVAHVSPTRFIQQLGGWLRGGEMERLAKTLEDGGIRQLEYMRGASQFFDGFVADKENRKWLRTASGKNAQWIKVDVPVGYEGTETGAKVKMQTVYITPMMRVSLMLHSRNADNLRHIKDGGITIPNRSYYAKGDMANAYAKGTRIKMTPEAVRAIVNEAAPQERAFANVLHKYFNEYSTPRINEVSMLIDGFERAGGENYFHIKTDPNFLAKQPEQIQKNLSLENIGSIVNERVHAGNPIVLQDASDALTEHIDTISKYYGYTAAIRDFNAVMQYTFHEEGNAFSGSNQETVAQKWGAGAQGYLNQLLADLQQRSSTGDAASKMLAKLRGNLAGATLMLNPAVAISQTASYPGAMQTVGVDGLLYGLRFWDRADMKLIEKYSPLLWYRNQGNSTQELGDYMSEQGLEQKLPWLLNWIQKMDSATIKRLWIASEYRVKQDTGMKPGDAAGIQAGTDAYYQAVAEVFNRAVLDTQPNYTTMQRPQILRSGNDLTKFLTMYKTVPLQYYNMMYEAVGRLQADAERAKANPDSTQAKEDLKKSRSFAAKTFVGILGANTVYVAMKALIKGLTGRGKKYQDEEGNYFTGQMWKQLGLDLLETYAGSVIAGTELLQLIESGVGSLTGNKLKFYGTEISALSYFNDLGENFVDLMGAIGSMSLDDGLDAIKATALNLASGLGIPAKNAETYLKGILKWFAPEWVAKYENAFDEVEKSDITGTFGRDQNAAIRTLMDNRTEGLSDDTIDELQRLWNAGQKNALPSAVPSSISVNGEDVALDAAQKKTFRDRWNETVSRSLEELMASDAYLNADDKGKAKLINKLYGYASQLAKAEIFDESIPDSWVVFGQALEENGLELATYLNADTMDKNAMSDLSGAELTGAIRTQLNFRTGGVNDSTVQEVQRLYEAGFHEAVMSDVTTSVTVEGETMKLTAGERVGFLNAWREAVGDGLDAMVSSETYQQADDKRKAQLLDKLYDYASATAKASVNAEYQVQKWVSQAQEAVNQGIALNEYLQFRVGLSDFDSVDDSGSDSVAGLKTHRQIELLRKTGWTPEQTEAVYLDTIANESTGKQLDTMRKAGFSVDQALDVLTIYGKGADWERVQQIIRTNASDSAKVKSLSLYLSGSAYSAACAGYHFHVNMNNWVKGRNTADANRNGAIDQTEVTAFIDGLSGLGIMEKAYLWQMLTPTSKSKKNPYSTTFGLEIWEWMQEH